MDSSRGLVGTHARDGLNETARKAAVLLDVAGAHKLTWVFPSVTDGVFFSLVKCWTTCSACASVCQQAYAAEGRVV